MKIQFADKFVADLETGELFRNGKLRRLQDKPSGFWSSWWRGRRDWPVTTTSAAISGLT